MTPEQFKEAREKLGLTAYALAKAWGCHQSVISRYESGETKKIQPIAASYITYMVEVEARPDQGEKK